MKIDRKIILFLAVPSILALTACSVFDPNNGSRVIHNTKEQLVDPYAGYGDVRAATLDGTKAEKLLQEYRTERADAPTEKLTEIE